MEEHTAHFKPNIQLLNKSGNSSVYSVLSAQNENHSNSTHFNAPTLFSNNVRQSNESVPSTNMEGSHHSHSNLTFPTMPVRNQDHGSSNHLSDSYSSNVGASQRPHQTQHAPPPTIFSASINSANLLSSGNSNEQGSHLSGAHQGSNQTKDLESSTAQGVSRYGQNIPIGSNNLNMNTLSTSSTSSSNNTGNYTQSTSNLHQIAYSQASSNIQYAQQSSTIYQTSGTSMVSVDGSQVSSGQPTYVLLQAPNDSDSNSQPQVFLAMQTTGLSNQDSQHQPYITLQPVSVDGSDLSNNTIVQEGVTLQQAVMQSANNAELAGESKPGETGQPQVVLSIPGQQSLMSSSSNNGSLVTYLQPIANIGVPVSNIEQGQVIMASSDLQGNVTIHNVANISNRKNVLNSTRQGNQSSTNLSTPRRRLSQDPRSCDQCGRTFKYPSDLKKHLQIHTDIKKFECEDCNRAFRRLHQLNVHRRIHTGEKPYVCGRCNAQFRHDSTLTMHIRTRHDHLKPFTCEGCSKKFGRMSHLRKHQRNVCGRNSLRGGAGIVRCKFCDTVFSKKNDLKAHFPLCEKKPAQDEKDNSMASPQIRFECDTCNKVFARVYDYKRHQLSHSDEKPYGCPQCGKMFKERSSLNKHVKRMHCSEGDGTIPIEDDGIIAGDDDEDEEDEDLSIDDENESVGLSMANINTAGGVKTILTQSSIIGANNVTGEVVTSNGQTIPATEILNFPEVAEALGINSGAHATVLDTDGNSTMIAITQPGNLETSEVSMDIDQNIIQDGTIIVTDGTEGGSGHYITTHEQLSQITPVRVDGDAIDGSEDITVIYNPENSDVVFSSSGEIPYTSSLASTMVFKTRDSGETFIKQEDEIADHVKAERAAAHDLQPEDDEQPVLLEE